MNRSLPRRLRIKNRALLALVKLAVFSLLTPFAMAYDDGSIKQPIPPGCGIDQMQAGTGNTPPITKADWSSYNHDVRGWRFNSAETKLSPMNAGGLVEKWRFPRADSAETIGAVHATPSVVNGEVYFGTATFPAFYKLDANGKLLWVYRNQARRMELPPAHDGVLGDKLLSTIRAGGTTSSALVFGDAVCFADIGGWIYCLDAIMVSRSSNCIAWS